MAGEPVTGTVNSGVTTTSTAPVLIGGVDANGVARTLQVNANGSLVVAANQLAAALGVQFEPYNRVLASAVLAPSSGAICGMAVYATAGATLTGIKTAIATAAAGTSPTTARFGVADNTGKILAVSANVNAAASWPTGIAAFPFSAPIAAAYSGVYILCFIVNGTWGSTQPTTYAVSSGSAAGLIADGANPPPSFQWTAQTDLPAVNSSLTMTTPTTRQYWLALY